ncbi:MAG: hypothetical protein LUE26_05465 [Alistipes sp.]|nr:hypothetical protein [Alistipes sp.]
MKKLLCLVAFFLLSFSVFPQAHVRPTYEGDLSISYSTGTGANQLNRVKYETTHGVLLENLIFIGVGTGIHRYELLGDTKFNAIPVFGTLKLYIAQHCKIRPFVTCNIGYALGTGYASGLNGVYLSPQFGIAKSIINNTSIFLTAGYDLQQCGYYDYYESLTMNLSAFTLRIGLTF